MSTHWVTECIACLLATAVAADTSWSLRNSYFHIQGQGSTIKHLACDAGGHRAYSENLIREIQFAGLKSIPEGHIEIFKNRIRRTGFLATTLLELANESANTAVLLQPGKTLGESFTVGQGMFTAVSVKLPTWHTTDSAATISLRREGPNGEIIASRRAENMADNSWQVLSFDPQPAGEYVVELSEAKGQVGWWSHTEAPFTQGQAYADGVAQPTIDRVLRVTGAQIMGEATWTLELQGKTLSISLEVTPHTPESAPQWPLYWTIPWVRDGYDVSDKAVPFFRFFTDTQRYMPIEQLKRSDIGGHLTFNATKWIEAEGTGAYDLRFSANGLWLDWDTEPKDLRLRLRTLAANEKGGVQRTNLKVTVLPRKNTVPEDWPAFHTPDAKLTEDLNRFFYERAFTYPAPAGPAPWLEWSALIRFWIGGPSLEGQGDQLARIMMADDGYVYTWGDQPGWPFPDPKRYDTRHFDTNARFILACWRYVCWTRDEDFLRDQAERIRRAMNYQLTTLQGQDGLIITASKDVTGKHMGVGNNYWDILPFGHLDAYANVVYYASLKAMAEIEELIEDMGGIKTNAPARSPVTYRRLAEQTKRAYNQTFWDEARGRYIGCIDIDGECHDYGFTFINLEAMAYGLASEEQAKRIYHWMETEPTSTGKADTYNAYVFAPRANTIHNPRWSPEEGGKTLEPDNPTPPWWFFGWHGTPYGNVQCQDGGAILYTSFFDLMARTKLIGPENAWQRWSEILARYREPDRLCGGPPLYRGENPQRVNPGAVGVDIPFPESGLVPIWFLYGVAGVNATAQGLVIQPRLPQALPWLEIRNITYRGLTFDLRVTPTSARLLSKTPGYRFTWQQSFAKGEGCVFTEPPLPAKGFPSRPQSPLSSLNAEWIWAPGGAAENETIFLRHTFELPARPKQANLDIAADNYWTLYVNGLEVGTGEGWAALRRIPLGKRLTKGRNVLAVQARNADGPGGVIARLTIRIDRRPIEIGTNTQWRVTRKAPAEWTDMEFDDSGWEKAMSLGKPPVGPWGEITVPK